MRGLLVLIILLVQATPTPETWDVWIIGRATISESITYVNIRDAPAITGAIVGRAVRGVIEYNPQGDSNGWLRVRQNNATGWVSGTFLTIRIDSSPTPSPTQPTPRQTATPTPSASSLPPLSSAARLRVLELLMQAEQLEWQAAALRLEASQILEGVLCC